MRLDHHRDCQARARTPLDERLADEARFIRTWLENPVGTGAVSPSSRALARAMARHVDPERPGPVVELGPGTGPVTEALIARGVAPERLILVEYDPAFCRLLARRYPAATVIRGDAYALGETLAGVLDGPAATIVSSLPLRNVPERRRLALIEEAFALLAPGGAFVQFTYGLVSPIPLHRAPPCEAEVSEPVWLNLPPARVWVYREAEVPEVIRPRDRRRALLKLKSSRELLADELREQGDRLKRGLRHRAERVIRRLRPRGEDAKEASRREARPRRRH